MKQWYSFLKVIADSDVHIQQWPMSTINSFPDDLAYLKAAAPASADGRFARSKEVSVRLDSDCALANYKVLVFIRSQLPAAMRPFIDVITKPQDDIFNALGNISFMTPIVPGDGAYLF